MHHRFCASILLCLVAVRPAPAEHPPLPDLSGCWSGRWLSCTTGHQGPLHATICRIDEGHYCAEFRGRFFLILPFRYRVMLNVVGQEGGKVLLAGQKDMGRRYGVFTYCASADCCEFAADYFSCKDQGNFFLCRTCCGK